MTASYLGCPGAGCCLGKQRKSNGFYLSHIHIHFRGFSVKRMKNKEKKSQIISVFDDIKAGIAVRQPSTVDASVVIPAQSQVQPRQPTSQSEPHTRSRPISN